MLYHLPLYQFLHRRCPGHVSKVQRLYNYHFQDLIIITTALTLLKLAVWFELNVAEIVGTVSDAAVSNILRLPSLWASLVLIYNRVNEGSVYIVLITYCLEEHMPRLFRVLDALFHININIYSFSLTTNRLTPRKCHCQIRAFEFSDTFGRSWLRDPSNLCTCWRMLWYLSPMQRWNLEGGASMGLHICSDNY